METLKEIIRRLEDTFDGDPWYGRALMKVLSEVDASIVYKKPGEYAHSLIDLLYHMIAWQDFVLQQLTARDQIDPEALKSTDWREINPDIHTWVNGISEFTIAHHKIVDYLKTSSDELLGRSVKYRDYNMDFLLKGIIEHHIYHLGQIAYLKKFLTL